MVVQTASPSDVASITDVITGLSIAGGNVGVGISDVPTITDVIAQSSASPTIVVDPTFAHLNGRQVGRGNVSRSTIREKNAIVNVTFPSNISYVTGGIKMDFSKIGTIEKFKQVYLCSAAQLSTVFYTLFVPDANNLSTNGHLKFFNTSGVELANGSLAIQGLTFKCYIRGV